MKKRVIAGLLAAVMCTGLMPGASVVRADEEPYTVGISYVTLGSDPTDLQMVQDAMSEYTMEKLGCKVELKSVPISNMTSQYSLWASSGEKVDLLCLCMQNMGACPEYSDSPPGKTLPQRWPL